MFENLQQVKLFYFYYTAYLIQEESFQWTPFTFLAHFGLISCQSFKDSCIKCQLQCKPLTGLASVRSLCSFCFGFCGLCKKINSDLGVSFGEKHSVSSGVVSYEERCLVKRRECVHGVSVSWGKMDQLSLSVLWKFRTYYCINQRWLEVFSYSEKNPLDNKPSNLFSHIFIGYDFGFLVLKVLALDANLCHWLSGNDQSAHRLPNFIMYTVNCNPGLQQTRR